MTDHLDTWIKARALIAEERHWCQHHAAVSISGYSVYPTDRAAVAFCLYGACRRAARDNPIVTADALMELAAFAPLNERASWPGRFNDTHSHAEVLALLDRAIAQGRATRSLPALIEQSIPVSVSPALAKEPV